MKALEKWQRLENPTCLADYGLSLSESEMREFPAGRAILCDIIREKRRRVRESRIIACTVKSAAATINAITLDVLMGKAP